ncbi:MAG: protein kinase [Pseudomonadota bacterium]
MNELNEQPGNTSDAASNLPAGSDSQTPAGEETLFRSDETVYRRDDSVSQRGTAGDDEDNSTDTTPEVDVNSILKSRFVLEERLGSGGRGSVFRARDLRKVEARDNQPYVAVKVLNNDFRQHPEAFIALEREASKSQTLRHSNIVSIFDFDKDGDIPYNTM